MTITTAAVDVIRDWLKGSPVADPVVCLVQASDTPREITEALKREVDRKELEQISLTSLAKVPKYLYPAIYPRSHFLWIYVNIHGFRFAPLFAHPRHARAAMKTGTLDVADRGLVLKDADGRVVLPTQKSPAF